MDRFKVLRTMYEDAGVRIDILKLGEPNWSDAEIDYAFNAARAVGARGISFEISKEAAERMAPFATKHEMYVGMHNHTQVADEDFSFDVPLSYSPYNMLNLDIGHYVAGLGTSPIPIIRKYHDRITHLHLKDRKSAENGGDNVPWGEGDTPIGEVLRLLQNEKGEPLSIGRKTRLIPKAIERALHARDHGCCRFPGCGNRRYLHSHHVEHWSNGGETSLGNLMLLCTKHHTLVHEGGFRIERDFRNRWSFLRPDGIAVPECGYRSSDRVDDAEAYEIPPAGGLLSAVERTVSEPAAPVYWH
jgi:hypothetical protein